MKKFSAILLSIILIFSLFGCNKNDGEESVKLLAEKTPAELYAEAIQYIKSLTNYEIVIESLYKTTIEGVEENDPAVTLYRSSGDSFYYNYTATDYEEFFLHDGSKLYKDINGEKEQIEIAFADFMAEWGSITDNGMLIDLPESKFADQLFLVDGDSYKLEFIITVEEYTELVGGNITEPAAYQVCFDKDGTVTGFSRSMKYNYEDTTPVQDDITVYIKNVGKVEKILPPDDVSSYRIPLKAEEIDLSEIKDITKFVASEEATDYVLFTFKTDAKVKIDENNTADGYEAKLLIRLFPNVAPKTVEAFKKFVAEGFYNGNIIDFIAKVENSYSVVQLGSKEEKSESEEGAETEEDKEIYIKGEFTQNGFTNNLSHKRGVLAAMRTNSYETAMNYLFMCQADSKDLDGNYTTFGYIVNGIENLDVLSGVEIDEEGKPKTDVVLTSVSFVKENT